MKSIKGGMTATVVRFSFSFRCARPGALAVATKWCLAENADARPELWNQLELQEQQGDATAYRNDGKITAPEMSFVLFQFYVKYKDHEYSSAVSSYKIHGASAPRDTIALGDYERAEHEEKNVTIRFKMNYQTYFGQDVIVVGSLPELGFWEISKGLRLSHCGSQISVTNGMFSDVRFNWQGDLVLPRAPLEISYKYFVVSKDALTEEPSELRMLCFEKGDGPANYEFADLWRWSQHAQNMVVRRLFDTTFSVKRQLEVPGVKCQEQTDTVNCMFLAHCAIVARARTILVVGSIPELGNWNPGKGVELQPMANLQWSQTVKISKSSFPFEYKFIASCGDDVIVWEPYDNRKATMSKWGDDRVPSCVALDSWHLTFSNIAFHGAGVFVNVQSIRNGNSFFDFSIMGNLSEWARSAGFTALHFIGLLDTTALTTKMEDLPVSGVALNPLYVDFSEVGKLSITGTDVVTVLEQKLKVLRDLWETFRKSQPPTFDDFCKNNSWWLNDYEELCYSKVPGERKEDYVHFVRFVQYYCYSKLMNSIVLARDKNVAVGIDLPFALSENSAEVRSHPELFMKKYHLGIPPSPTNPIGVVLNAYPYNFEHATKWFAARIEHFGTIFAIIRLSSTINFFRQWIVPRKTCVRAVFGRFSPAVSLSYSELETWGLWDIERYTQPFIRPHLVEELFNTDQVAIDTIFMGDGGTHFDPKFTSEKALLKTPLGSEDKEQLRARYKEELLRLFGEVLLIEVGEDEYHPRLQLRFAPTVPGPSGVLESSSFSNLPSFHQAPLLQIHDEFILNRQRGLWASTGRQNLLGIISATSAIILSDAAGSNGELCEEALQGTGILSFRAHLEGRSPNSNFDDIRNYPYFSIAAPTGDTDSSLRDIWNTQGAKRKHLWEDEFYETNMAPNKYDDRVASAMMKLHCWSGSMWVMFPIDTLIGAGKHLVKENDKVVVDIGSYLGDAGATEAIAKVLKDSKRM